MKITADHRDSIALYVASIAAVLLQLIPTTPIQIFSLLLLAALMFGLPIIRRAAKDGSLLRNHATYLYRTLWLWSAILTVGMAIAGYFVSKHYDIHQIIDITTRLGKRDIDDPDIRKFLMIAGAATAPSMIYAVWRLARGTFLAAKGRPLPNPKTLF